MSEKNFTPWPWFVASGTVHHAGRIVIVANGMPSNSPLAFVGGKDWDDTAAHDAALIAAAPELYAALESAIPFLAAQPTDAVISCLAAANAALKKARGES